MNKSAERYHEALKNIPPPGTGCHPALLSVANLGVFAEVPPQVIHDDIRQAIPQGIRRIPEREIEDAINKALRDHSGGTFTARPRPQPIVQDGKSALQKIIDQGKIHDEVDLWESSPIPLWDDPKDDPALLLSTLFKPTDLVWIGDRLQTGILGDTIRPASAWITHFKDGGQTAPYIILNPMTGLPAMKKDGDKETLRGDGNIKEYRFCMAEFDNLPRQDQIRFWSAAKLPVVALIDSGGKSVHAWLHLSKMAQVTSSGEWETEIKTHLYDRLLVPLGIDAACKNPARLSRLPGHYRTEKGAWQRLLWLSPEGSLVC
jgi:hypothetical protein